MKEKAAYLKGLIDGLGIDESTKEGKVIKAMSELLSEMAETVDSIDEDVTHAYDQINDLSEELEDLEADLYEEDDAEDEEEEDDSDDETEADDNADVADARSKSHLRTWGMAPASRTAYTATAASRRASGRPRRWPPALRGPAPFFPFRAGCVRGRQCGLPA